MELTALVCEVALAVVDKERGIHMEQSVYLVGRYIGRSGLIGLARIQTRSYCYVWGRGIDKWGAVVALVCLCNVSGLGPW
ncbi:hypothetical protein DSUL_150086 [Desulfovibrionales bacterium]